MRRCQFGLPLQQALKSTYRRIRLAKPIEKTRQPGVVIQAVRHFPGQRHECVDGVVRTLALHVQIDERLEYEFTVFTGRCQSTISLFRLCQLAFGV